MDTTLTTNSRQVRRQINRIVAKAARSVDKQRARGAKRKGSAKGDKLAASTYPQHYDALLNPTSIEQAVMRAGVPF